MLISLDKKKIKKHTLFKNALKSVWNLNMNPGEVDGQRQSWEKIK